jgi:hypothetical protein
VGIFRRVGAELGSHGLSVVGVAAVHRPPALGAGSAASPAERDKADGYPDAHLQIDATSELFSTLNDPRCDTGRSLAQLHFPVGGKRFRPCLEDIIEFLIVERLVLARDGYEKVIEAGREGFRKNQLMAAMRRDRATVEVFVARYGIGSQA